jgi:hypothetical protein
MNTPVLIFDEFQYAPSAEFAGKSRSKQKIARSRRAAMVNIRANADDACVHAPSSVVTLPLIEAQDFESTPIYLSSNGRERRYCDIRSPPATLSLRNRDSNSSPRHSP